jgi:hypothetical protein
MRPILSAIGWSAGDQFNELALILAWILHAGTPRQNLHNRNLAACFYYLNTLVRELACLHVLGER